MRLLLVELDRLRSRRAIALMLLGALLLTALLVATALWDTRPVSDAELAHAESQAATAASDPRLQREQEQCAERPEEFFGPGATVAECERVLTPRAADFLPRNTLDLGAMVEHRGVALVVVLTALLILAGVTFAGADWANRSITNQLLFRPRRDVVWLAKAGAVTVAALVASAALVAGFWLVLWSAAQARGLDTSAAVLDDVLWSSVRGVTLATAAALGGYALTMLLRSTLAAVAVVFGFAVVGEALVMSVPVHLATRWSLVNNVFAWLDGGTRVFDTDVTCAPGRGGCEQAYVLGAGHGAAYLGLLLLAALLTSWWSFRRRDIP